MSRRRGRGVAAVAPALAGLLLLGGCSSGGGSGLGYLAGEGTVTTYDVGHRKEAPAIRGTTLDGAQLSLASYRGKIVVLNFWGSWCPPCRVESPFLQVMATDYAPKGVQFVGLDLRDDPNQARAFLLGVSTYPNLFDPDLLLTLLFNGVVPPEAIPSTLIIDRSGRIAARIIGPTTEPRLTAVLAPLVAGAA